MQVVVLRGVFCLALILLSEISVCWLPPISLSSVVDENHKDVSLISKRKTRSFSSLDSSTDVVEGPADLLVIVKVPETREGTFF